MIISVAVGIIFNQDDKVLVALRPKHKQEGGRWEFPGGKVEMNETVTQALNRELFEEVGIQVEQAKPLLQCDHSYEQQRVLLDVWQVLQFSGVAYGKEGQKIAWVSLMELTQLPVLSANYPIVQAILSVRCEIC